MSTEELEVALEARIKKYTGRVVRLVLIGAEDDRSNVIVDNGRTYIKSLNNRLYDTEALEAAAALFEAKSVYDNHPKEEKDETVAENILRNRQRSVTKEWLGALRGIVWNSDKLTLEGDFAVADEGFRTKLSNAKEVNLLDRINFSINALAKWVYRTVQGVEQQVAVKIGYVNSLDVVSHPAAGGRIIQILESQQAAPEHGETVMPDNISAADVAPAEDSTNESNGVALESILAAIQQQNEQFSSRFEAMEGNLATMRQERELQVAQEGVSNYLAGRSNLPAPIVTAVKDHFKGQAPAVEQIEKFTDMLVSISAQGDQSGAMEGANTPRGNSGVQVSFAAEDKQALVLAYKLMGSNKFNSAVEHANNMFDEANRAKDDVALRMHEFSAMESWVRAGKPDFGRHSSEGVGYIIRDILGGNPMIDPRAYEALGTSGLSSVFKDTLNLAVANDYSVRQRWYEPFVTIHETNNIDDFTLIREYGMNELREVQKGAQYKTIDVSDDEEVAKHVKRGELLEISIEDLMSDKVNYFRRIPMRMSNAWYNTISRLVSRVFTLNNGAGPVMGTTGNLFNTNAVTVAGGHANAAAAALDYNSLTAGRTAMMVQTDMPNGEGERLSIPFSHLLVSQELENVALSLRNSELVPAQSGGAVSGGQLQTVNSWRGQFDVQVVPTWDSASMWALVAPRNRIGSIHLIFPRGGRTPSLFNTSREDSYSMMNRDVLAYKVRMMTYRMGDQDCAPVSDFRGLYKGALA